MSVRAGVTEKYDFCHSRALNHCSTYGTGQPQAKGKKSCGCGK